MGKPSLSLIRPIMSDQGLALVLICFYGPFDGWIFFATDPRLVDGNLVQLVSIWLG